MDCLPVWPIVIELFQIVHVLRQPDGPWPLAGRQGVADGAGKLFGGGQPAFELCGQFRLELVFGYPDGIGFRLERELDFYIVLFRAKDDADGRPGLALFRLKGSGRNPFCLRARARMR